MSRRSSPISAPMRSSMQVDAGARAGRRRRPMPAIGARRARSPAPTSSTHRGDRRTRGRHSARSTSPQTSPSTSDSTTASASERSSVRCNASRSPKVRPLTSQPVARRAGGSRRPPPRRAQRRRGGWRRSGSRRRGVRRAARREATLPARGRPRASRSAAIEARIAGVGEIGDRRRAAPRSPPRGIDVGERARLLGRLRAQRGHRIVVRPPADEADAAARLESKRQQHRQRRDAQRDGMREPSGRRRSLRQAAAARR